jgi:hypothetical protein
VGVGLGHGGTAVNRLWGSEMEEAHQEGSPTMAVSWQSGTSLGVTDLWLRGPAARPVSDEVPAEAPREAVSMAQR